VSDAAHNDEQTMLWQNIAKLFVKSENNECEITHIRGDYAQSIKELKEFTVELYARLQSCKGDVAGVKQNTKNKLKSFKRLFQKKIKKVKQTAACAANDADMEVFKYIDTLRIQIDELRETTEKQNAKIEELSRVNATYRSSNNNFDDVDINDLKYKMTKMQEEIADLNELYDDDFHRFCRREDDLKDKIAAVHDEASNAHTFALSAKQNSDERIDAAIKAIETWGSDIYRIEQEMKDMNREIRNEMETDQQATEYWIERELKSFETDKERINSQIENVRSYANTIVAGDLREEFARAISREIEFESKVSAELVQGVHNELTAKTQELHNELIDMITRSNEIHTARYYHALGEVEKTKEDATSMCQALKNSIGFVDAELSEVKEDFDFVKEDIARLNIEIEDQKESIRGDIYADMDADYHDLKKYIYNKFKKHMKHEHSEVKEESDAAAADGVKNEDEQVVDTTNGADQENLQVLGEESNEDVAAESNLVNGKDTDIVIIMDDASYHTSDDE
jgi:peptidoglycan hydrolase CwlO-like protein